MSHHLDGKEHVKLYWSYFRHLFFNLALLLLLGDALFIDRLATGTTLKHCRCPVFLTSIQGHQELFISFFVYCFLSPPLLEC